MIFLLTQQPPIVLMHGFTDSIQKVDAIRSWLEDVNFTVVNCEVGNGGEDSKNLPISQQAQMFYGCLQQHKILENGFIGVGHSQGGIILRYYLQMLNTIKMLRIVTIGSPLAGYYCTDTNGCSKNKVLAVDVYSDMQQSSYAPSNYWRDPTAYSLYVEKSAAMALMNNERDYDAKRKENFMSVDKFIMFGSSYDEVIKPWQSSFFGYYENNSVDTVIPMEQTDVYKQDLFGLKSMDEQGRMIQINTNMLHSGFNFNETFVKNDLANVLRIKNDQQSNLTVSAKIGIVSGAIVLVVIIIGVILGYLIQRKHKNQQQHGLNVQLAT